MRKNGSRERAFFLPALLLYGFSGVQDNDEEADDLTPFLLYSSSIIFVAFLL